MNEGHTISNISATINQWVASAQDAGESAWRFALESAGDGLWDWYAPTSKLRVTDGWERLLGYRAPPEDWESLLHPDDLAIFHAELERHRQGETAACRCEYRLRTADGDYRWFLVRGKAMSHGPAGEPLHIVGTLVDITDRKQLERELVAEQSRHRAVMETVVDGIVVIDARGIIQSLNPAAGHIFGYAATELVGRSVNLLMPEPYRSAHDQHLRRYVETGQRHVIGYGREARGLKKNGSTFPINLAVSEMWIDGALYFTGIIRDISKRKQSEEALLIAASVYRSIGEAVVVTDADNHIISVNEPFTQLTGYDLFELLGEDPKILASGRQDRAFYEKMWRTLGSEGRWQGQIWNRRKNGQEYLEFLSISLIYDDNGEVLRHVAVFSEINA